MENDFIVNDISKCYTLVQQESMIAYRSGLSIALKKALSKTAKIENIKTLQSYQKKGKRLTKIHKNLTDNLG